MAPPTHSPTLPIQEAIIAKARPDLATIEIEIFDYVPEDRRPRTFVVFEGSFTTPDNAHGSIGWITISTLAVWTEERGFKQASIIKDRLIALFDHQPLVVAGFHHVETRHEFDQLLRDPQPTLRRALLRLRTSTEQD